MTVQFINSLYAMGVAPEQKMQHDYDFMQILQRYEEIEYWSSCDDYYLINDNNDNNQGSSSGSGSTSGSSLVSNISSDKQYTIAVVDFCDNSDADIDLDGDGTADMAHGNVVANLIKSSYKNSQVFTFDISENSSYSTNDRIVASLQYIINEMENGTCDYDAINLSLSSRITYSALSSALGVTITKDNVSQYSTQIRNWLLTTGKNNGYSTTAQVVELLEELEELGVDVYIAAANVNDGTDDELNLYTLANNTTSVGALSTSGSKASFSFDNSLIDTWALGEIEVKKLYDSSGNFAGYDLNNDGVKDIDKSFNSGGLSCSNPFLKGTSFASPYKLMQDLNT